MKILTANGWEETNFDPDTTEATYTHETGPTIIIGRLSKQSQISVVWPDGRAQYISNSYYELLGFLIHHRLIGLLSFIGVETPKPAAKEVA